MAKSLSYYLTLFVIKIKGIKKDFSTYPINYKKIRKDDVHKPKGHFFKNYTLNTFNSLESVITEVGKSEHSSKLLILIHGGAFVSGPAQHHWDSVKLIAKKTNLNIWLCDYPKAPETKIKDISANIDAIYQQALEKYNASNIYMIGDSVGGSLATSLIQRLVEQKKERPKKLILISPVMDASMSNPEIEHIEKTDSMLSKKGVLSAKQMCAGNIDLKDKMISPLYGSFEQFPETIFFIAQNDIMYPDEKLAIEKFKKANVKTMVFEGEGMPHIWPFLPVMREAKAALEEIIKIVND